MYSYDAFISLYAYVCMCVCVFDLTCCARGGEGGGAMLRYQLQLVILSITIMQTGKLY